MFVQGRKIDVTPRVKRWYNIPFTEEEIALGVRTGFVTLLWTGPSFDPEKNSTIDAVEVYASDRQSLVFPRHYYLPELSPPILDKTKHKSDFDDKEGHKTSGLQYAVRAIRNLCELVSPGGIASESGMSVLWQLIQDTALHPNKQLREELQELAKFLEPDKGVRYRVQDDRVLTGCSMSLDECKQFVGSTEMEPNEGASSTNKWKSISSLVRDCLTASSFIASERPINYLQSMENMLEKEITSGSIALKTSKLVLEGLHKTPFFGELTESVVTLSLTEMAINLLSNNSPKHSKSFAQFGNIRDYLDCADSCVVEKCCEAISSFFRDHGSIDSQHDLFSQLEAARLVAYQCDSCAQIPLKDVRYTLIEEDLGIE
jgi:hypothetical protein